MCILVRMLLIIVITRGTRPAVSNHSRVLNNNLISIDIPDDLLLCTNCNCTNDFQHAIDSLCHSINFSRMAASAGCVPTVRPPCQGGGTTKLNQRGTGHFSGTGSDWSRVNRILVLFIRL